MWIYEKKLQYPVKIKTPNPRLAQIIISQLGGPDGEIGASMRYLNQRYSMPEKQVAGLLTDIGTEELAHICSPYSYPQSPNSFSFTSFFSCRDSTYRRTCSRPPRGA